MEEPTNDQRPTTKTTHSSFVVRRSSFVAAAVVAAGALWVVTGWIQRRWGLDSVAVLFVSFGLFIVVGWALGAAAARSGE